MEPDSKNWAAEYLLDPLHMPDPSEETGPGSSFRPDAAKSPSTTIKPKAASVRSTSSRLTKTNPNNPYRKSLGTPPQSPTNANRRASVDMHRGAYPSPPPSASPNAGYHSPHSPSYRQQAFSDLPNGRRRRGSSLNERHPGDMSHRPLDQIAAEKRLADKSRHSTRKHHINPDTIDTLDDSGISSYHHGGPYDATLYARNNSYNSPLNALRESNSETLKATPHDKIVDSLKGHRPLDGVAAYAPGETDRMGQTYNYQQGENMMTDLNPAGGAYKRWPGIQYHDDDIKGKGEPSYSIEKALKEHTLDDKIGAEQRKTTGESGIEMKSQSHKRESSSGDKTNAQHAQLMEENGNGWWDGETPRRSGSFGKGIRKRFGSMRRHMHSSSQDEGRSQQPGRF